MKPRCSSTAWFWDKDLRFLTAFGMTVEGAGMRLFWREQAVVAPNLTAYGRVAYNLYVNWRRD